MPNITKNHAITYTNTVGKSLFSGNYFQLEISQRSVRWSLVLF